MIGALHKAYARAQRDIVPFLRLLGAVTSRVEAQVVRLALFHTLLDDSDLIQLKPVSQYGNSRKSRSSHCKAFYEARAHDAKLLTTMLEHFSPYDKAARWGATVATRIALMEVIKLRSVLGRSPLRTFLSYLKAQNSMVSAP
jgi:hypothetical protein